MFLLFQEYVIDYTYPLHFKGFLHHVQFYLFHFDIYVHKLYSFV